MDKETLDQINAFSWYQTIDFEPGIRSKGSPACGDIEWKNILKCLPKKLDGKRILDLGCNAGIFCVRAALLGAECIGVEDDSWKKDSTYFDQALFVKKFFETKIGRRLNIEYIRDNMEKVVYDPNIGKFDYCLGIASLYYAKNQKALVNRIYEISENVIARIRDDSKIEVFTKLFEDAGYKRRKVLREEMWEEVKRPTDDFYLFHYAR